MLNSVLVSLSTFSTLITYTLIIAITSEIESNISFTLANNIADISIGTEDTQSQLKLSEHDKHSIYHNNKTYKRGKARPPKRKKKSSNI